MHAHALLSNSVGVATINVPMKKVTDFLGDSQQYEKVWLGFVIVGCFLKGVSRFFSLEAEIIHVGLFSFVDFSPAK